LSKNGRVVAGYNVQIAVDDKYKLIVASEVVNDGNDTGQLHPMAKAAKEELGVTTFTVLADTGCYNGNGLKACEEDGIVAYVPQAKRTARLEAQGRISHEEWSLMALCYNFSRVLTIVGLDALIAYFAKRVADLSLLCPWPSPSMASQRS
jgi:hypothetical protein